MDHTRLVDSQTPPVEKYVQLARSMARRFAEQGDVENSDALGEALLALVEASRAWLPEMPANFQTYVRTCIFNALVSSRRKQVLRRLQRLANDPAVPVKPFDFVNIPPSVVEAIKQPPVGCQQERRDHQILLRHFIDGKSLSEIGLEYGMTKMAACYAVKRGIARVRRDHAGLLASDLVGWELPEE